MFFSRMAKFWKKCKDLQIRKMDAEELFVVKIKYKIYFRFVDVGVPDGAYNVLAVKACWTMQITAPVITSLNEPNKAA